LLFDGIFPEKIIFSLSCRSTQLHSSRQKHEKSFAFVVSMLFGITGYATFTTLSQGKFMTTKKQLKPSTAWALASRN
jgi:hypothetical protein